MHRRIRKWNVIIPIVLAILLLVWLGVSCKQILGERYFAREIGIHRLERSFYLEVKFTDHTFSFVGCLYRKMTFQQLTYADLLPDIELIPKKRVGDLFSTQERVQNFNDHLYKDPEYNSLRIRLETEGYIVPGKGLSVDDILNDPQNVYEMMAIAVEDGFDITKLTDAKYQ